MIGTIIAIVISVVAGVASYTQARKARQGGENGFLVTKADNDAGLNVIYGERRVGGIKVFKDISNKAVIPAAGRTVIGQNKNSVDATRDHWSSNRIWLDRIDVIGEGPIHSVTNIEIAGDAYTASRFTKKSLSHYRGIVMKGDSSQGWLNELGAVYHRWNSSSIGNRVAYVQSRFRNHQDDITYQGEPDIQYQVKGKLVWDPRRDVNYGGGGGTHLLADESTWEWSDNPALCLLDYLKGSYGRGLSIDSLDIPSFIGAANSCDASVAVPGVKINDTGSTIQVYSYEAGELVDILPGEEYPDYRPNQVGLQIKRLTCNIVLDPKDKVLENVKKLLESMKGNLPYHQGKYSLRLEDAANSVMHFGTEDIIGGITFGEGDQSERFNRVTIKFPNRNKRYQMDQVSWPQLDSAAYTAYLTEDNNQELWHEVDLSGVTDFYQAEDIAEFIVRNSRSSLQCEIKTKSKAIMLQPSDVITVTHPTGGWTAKKFRVNGTKVGKDFSCVLSLSEYQDSVYQWSNKASEPDAPNVGIASPYDDLPALTGLSGTVTKVDSARGVPHGLVTLTWDPVEDFEVKEYVLRYKQQSETVFQTAIYPEVTRSQGENPSLSFVAPQDDTTYDLYLHYTVTSSGRTSDVVTTTAVIPEYRLDLDIEWHDLEIEGPGSEAITDEFGDPLNRGDLSGMAVYLRNAELTLDGKITTEVNSLDSDIASLQQLLQDVTAGTADVYLQDNPPVAGVGGIPNPIVTNSRWYDTNDNNLAHVWDGSAWQSLADPRVGANEVDITALQVATTDPVTGLSANAAAISTLDTTVSTIDGVVTSNSALITGLQSQVTDPATGLVANANATSNLSTQVSNNSGLISSNSTDIVNLRADLTTAEGGVSGNAAALSVLDARVSTNEQGLATVAAFDIVDLQADLQIRTELNDENDVSFESEGGDDLELENNLSAIVAGSSQATRALTVKVEQTETGLVVQSQDITALRSDLTIAEGDIVAGAGATSALTTRVTQAEGTITSHGQDIVSLEANLSAANGAITGNATAVSLLDARVVVAEGGISSQASDISDLQVDLAATDGGVAANAGAIGGLDVRVSSSEGIISSHAIDITALEAAIALTDGSVSGNASAIGGLVTRVDSAEGAISSQASDITDLEVALALTDGNVSGNASAIGGLDTRVLASEGLITAQASDISDLESALALTDGNVSGNASAIGGLSTRVLAAEGTITSIAQDVTTVSAAVTNNDDEITAQAQATSDLTTRVVATEDGVSELSAEYNVRLDVNGNIAGFGLVNDSTSSTFGILADKFVMTDANGSGTSPFSVANGVVTMQDVTINGALILNGSVTTNEIEDGAVTSDKITVSDLSSISADIGTITAGSISAELITGDIGESNIVQSITSQSFNGPSGEVTALTGSLPASTSSSGYHQVYANCTGYFASTSGKVYYLRLYFRETPTSAYTLASTVRLKSSTDTATAFAIAGGLLSAQTGEVGFKVTIRRYGSNGVTPDGSTGSDSLKERTAIITGVR